MPPTARAAVGIGDPAGLADRADLAPPEGLVRLAPPASDRIGGSPSDRADEPPERIDAA